VSDEFENEPIRGLPGLLPPGESILWQGSPRWRGLAEHTFAVRWVSAYFGLILVGRGAVAARDGASLGEALLSALALLPLAAACLGLLGLLAWLNARGTVYTITTRRVVMRFGVALPMSVNLPFKQLVTAELALRANGEGDIALHLTGPGRIAYLSLWPHARPWQFSKPQPMLRSIPEARRCSELLAEAVRAWAAAEAPTVVVTQGGPSGSSEGPGRPGALRLATPFTAEAGR
jgi:hypothetical protein